jgi:lysine/ornithine N-monooxygenase
MPEAADIDLAVVGAGPYGVSLAATNRDLRTAVFGDPFGTWEQMEPTMQLRAAPDEMNLSARPDRGTLAEWSRTTGAEPEQPLRVRTFLSYGRWFVDRFVPDLRGDKVEAITEAAGGRLAVEAHSGAVRARAVVLSVGITPFPYAPPELEALVDGDQVAYATEPLRRPLRRDERVAVIGGGQSAVEAAARAAAAGAATTLLVRHRVNWFADREPFAPRGALGRRLYHMLYPAVGYGPPPLNRLVLRPDLFARLPRGAARSLNARLLRPGASPWLRDAVADAVDVREHTVVQSVNVNGDVRLLLGDDRTLEVDRLLLGTGFRFRPDRLDFLPEPLRRRIATRDGWPVLDRWFRSSDPRISFVGYAAEGRFGPIARFVLGVPFTTARVREQTRELAR